MYATAWMIHRMFQPLGAGVKARALGEKHCGNALGRLVHESELEQTGGHSIMLLLAWSFLLVKCFLEFLFNLSYLSFILICLIFLSLL